MINARLIEKRQKLQHLLSQIEAGKFPHFDVDENGTRLPQANAQSRASLERRIAELDEKMAEESNV